MSQKDEKVKRKLKEITENGLKNSKTSAIMHCVYLCAGDGVDTEKI